MTNEKLNSNSDWRNKLDELESIQGEVFNKETSWNKLHERLYSKRGNRKAIWYWLAAACLFFVLFISLFMSHKKENILVKNNLDSNKNNPFLVQRIPMIDKDTSQVVSSVSNKNKLTVHSIHATNKRNTDVDHNIIVNEMIQNKNEENTIPQVNIIAVTPVDSVISIATNIPQKKKLKVVHINELGDPVSESPNIARYNEQHSFQFKFMSQEVYTRSSSTVTKSGFKIFTTKNLTAN